MSSNAQQSREPTVRSGDRILSHDALRRQAARAAEGLHRAGVGEGDCVALLLRNDLAFFEASLAAMMLGAYAVPINWHATADEAGYVLRDCGAKALVAHEVLLEGVATALPVGLHVFEVATPPEIAAAYRLSAHGGDGSWEALIAANPPLAAPSTAPRSSMIYTSGTTGRPKGVRRAATAAAQAAPAFSPFGFDLPDPVTVLVNGPMYHSAPNFHALGAFQRGADIVLQPRFDAEEMLALIEQHRITHMHIVPTMFVRLLRLPPDVRTRHDLSSLRFVVHGAAPCPPQVKRAMIEWWGPVISEYYGSTETGIAVWHDAHEALRKPGTVGRALPGCEVRIYDAAGAELGPDQIGEVYLRAAGIPDFTYHGQDERRREVGRGDLVTVGDVGYLDADGYLFLCDRKRDMIISGGVNIYPAEIETVLITMPGVRDCAAFGIPDEEFGEAVCVFVEPDGEDAPTTEAVRAFLGERLARFKLPRVIELARDLPREDTGKIFKRRLREPYWAAAGRAI